MEIITSREFRDKQALYLNKVDEGQQIIVQRGRNKSYKIVPVTSDDALMSKEDFFAKVDKSLEQVRIDGGIKVKSSEELDDLLDSL